MERLPSTLAHRVLQSGFRFRMEYMSVWFYRMKVHTPRNIISIMYLETEGARIAYTLNLDREPYGYSSTMSMIDG